MKFNKLLSKMNESTTDIDDALYMDAVERGDMETAQRMVDEAANRALVKSVVREPRLSSRDASSKPLLRVYHGTNSEFSIFEIGRLGVTDYGWLGAIKHIRNGIFFTENRSFAKTFAKSNGGDRIISAYLDIHNPFYMDNQSLSDNLAEKAKTYDDADKGTDGGDIAHKEYEVARALYNNNDKWSFFDENEGSEFVAELKRQGYDGAFFHEEGHGLGNDIDAQSTWVAFHPSQIKSADPVTYDDAGNVIPLSKRFNPSVTDIRESTEGNGRFLELTKTWMPPKDKSRVAAGCTT